MGLLKRLFGDRNEGTLKKVVRELQHTHDLQEVIELLNILNDEGREGLWITIVFWDIEPRRIEEIEMIGNREVVADCMFRLFVSAYRTDVYPVRRIETHSSIDKAMGRLFDTLCFNHMLLCAKCGETDKNQLILYVR